MNFTHNTGFYFFRIILPTVVFLIQAFLFLRVRAWEKSIHPGRRWIRILTAALFLFFNLALIGVFILRPRVDTISPWFRYGLMYPFYIWHASTVFIGLVLVIVAVVKLPFRAAWLGLRAIQPIHDSWHRMTSGQRYAQFDSSRRMFLRRATGGLAMVSFGGAASGILLGRTGYELTETQIGIKNLPAEFVGFSIGLVSDVHSSIFMSRSEMEDYVSVLNELRTDMVVVPGDFVNSTAAEVYPFGEAFSGLHAPHGVFGVMGNHDFYTQEPEVVAREVNACGIRLLRDEGMVIEKGGAQLYLAGIDDIGAPLSAAARIRQALADAPPSVPRILLCHRPYFFPQAADQDIGLVLSGHTHGGQIVLGRIGGVAIAPATMVSPYVAGNYSLRGAQMYVSRGLGTVGVPIRLNCPPEVTRVVLRKA